MKCGIAVQNGNMQSFVFENMIDIYNNKLNKTTLICICKYVVQGFLCKISINIIHVLVNI